MLKILYLIISFENRSNRSENEEIRAIEHAIKGAESRDTLSLSVQRIANIHDLTGALMRVKPHVIHFGIPTETDHTLCLVDTGGALQYLDADMLKRLCEVLSDNIRMIILNQGYTKRQIDILLEHLDYVVNVKRHIGKGAAIAFMTQFYTALGHHRTIGEACALGNLAAMIFGEANDDIADLECRPGVSADERDLTARADERPRSERRGHRDSAPTVLAIVVVAVVAVTSILYLRAATHQVTAPPHLAPVPSELLDSPNELNPWLDVQPNYTPQGDEITQQRSPQKDRISSLSPEQTSPEQTSPEQTSPEQTSPERTTPKQTTRRKSKKPPHGVAQMTVGATGPFALELQPRSSPPPAVERDRYAIRQRVRALRHRMRACYKAELKNDPESAGTVTVTFQVEPSGAVTGVTARGTTAGVRRCVTDAIERLTFEPLPDAAPALVTYPLDFTPSRQ